MAPDDVLKETQALWKQNRLRCGWFLRDDTDRRVLLHNGHDVQTLRQFPTFVEAEVRRGADGVILQWVQDSAFRFFPLVEHPDFGLALHPFDLATLAFDGTVPDIEGMVKTWRMMLREADDIAALLPEDHVGTCILTRNGDLFDGTLDVLQLAVENDMLVFHEGAIRGAWPHIIPNASASSTSSSPPVSQGYD